jgi:hypothetical protein
VAEPPGCERSWHRSGPGLLVVSFVLWLTGALHDVPKVAPAAIVISATVGLFDVPAMTRLYRQDRFEFGVAVGTIRRRRRARNPRRDPDRRVPVTGAADRADIEAEPRGSRRGRRRRRLSRTPDGSTWKRLPA